MLVLNSMGKARYRQFQNAITGGSLYGEVIDSIFVKQRQLVLSTCQRERLVLLSLDPIGYTGNLLSSWFSLSPVSSSYEPTFPGPPILKAPAQSLPMCRNNPNTLASSVPIRRAKVRRISPSGKMFSKMFLPPDLSVSVECEVRLRRYRSRSAASSRCTPIQGTRENQNSR